MDEHSTEPLDHYDIEVEQRYGPKLTVHVIRQGWLTSIDTSDAEDYDDRLTLWLSPEACEALAEALAACALRARHFS